MGTFHHDKGELHGITVVVDTNGDRVFIGRCDTMTEGGIVLLDVDMHEDGKDGQSKEAYVRQAAKFGHWKTQDRVAIPATQIVSVKRLGQVSTQ